MVQWNRMKKNSAIILFFVGMMIQVGAFFGEHAEQVPIIFRRISPEYHKAKAGLQALHDNGRLWPTNAGFAEISTLLLGRAQQVETKFQNGNFKISDFYVSDVGLSVLHVDQSGQYLDLQFTLATRLPINIIGGSFTWRDDELKEQVEQLKGKSILRFCLTLFIIGTGLEILAFFLERRSPHPTSATLCQNEKISELRE